MVIPEQVLHVSLALTVVSLMLKLLVRLPLSPLIANAQSTPTEPTPPPFAHLAHLEVLLPLDPLLLLTAHVWQIPTVAQLRAQPVLLAVPAMLAAMTSLIASARSTLTEPQTMLLHAYPALPILPPLLQPQLDLLTKLVAFAKPTFMEMPSQVLTPLAHFYALHALLPAPVLPKQVLPL